MAGSTAGSGPYSKSTAKLTEEDTEKDIWGAMVAPVVNSLITVRMRNTSMPGHAAGRVSQGPGKEQHSQSRDESDIECQGFQGTTFILALLRGWRHVRGVCCSACCRTLGQDALRLAWWRWVNTD